MSLRNKNVFICWFVSTFSHRQYPDGERVQEKEASFIVSRVGRRTARERMCPQRTALRTAAPIQWCACAAGFIGTIDNYSERVTQSACLNIQLSTDLELYTVYCLVTLPEMNISNKMKQIASAHVRRTSPRVLHFSPV